MNDERCDVKEIRAELEDIAMQLLSHAAIASRAGQSSQLEKLAVRVKGLKLRVSALGSAVPRDRETCAHENVRTIRTRTATHETSDVRCEDCGAWFGALCQPLEWLADSEVPRV